VRRRYRPPAYLNGVDLPTLRECQTYAAGYDNYIWARAALDETEQSASLRICESGSTCGARCFGYGNCAENIEDLRAIYL